jgi:GxxExxY protein
LIVTENEIAKVVVDTAVKIHMKLGPGLLECVYERVLAHELTKRGLIVERQKSISITYEDLTFDEGFRADMVVNDLVILELKSIEAIARVHKKQLLTYLRMADKRLGLLLNFGDELMKNGITRVANGLAE